MKRILITSTDVMMIQFLVPHVNYLSKNGYVVDIGCSSAEGYQNERYFETIRGQIPQESKFFKISTERNPFSARNMQGYKDLKSIINQDYDLIWTNEPVMGVMTRLAARHYRKNGGKVMYLAHGYHFFEKAPLKNWVFYPVEWLMSHFCDRIVLINWEDYYFTKKHFRVPCDHIDGIGLNVDKYKNTVVDAAAKRAELGIAEDDVLLLSVGELQSRKNHQVVFHALAKLADKKIKYILCGRGELLDELKALAKKLGIQDQVQFLGHRYDIAQILAVTDVFVHPSQREGLGIAAIEAMSASLPLITSDVQGIKDYVIPGQNGYLFDPNDVDGFAGAIQTLAADKELCKKYGAHNQKCAEKYSIENSVRAVEAILNDMINRK